MISWVCVCLLLASACAKPVSPSYSYSPAVGKGSGSNYATKGEGRVTAVRVWEISNNYITGMQFRYGYIWSTMVGRKIGTEQEMELFEGEAIVQVSGKFHPSAQIRQVSFVTSRGRFLMSGQPYGLSFNFYPKYPGAELLLVSGRFDGSGISSLGAHWGVVDTDMYNTST